MQKDRLPRKKTKVTTRDGQGGFVEDTVESKNSIEVRKSSQGIAYVVKFYCNPGEEEQTLKDMKALTLKIRREFPG